MKWSIESSRRCETLILHELTDRQGPRRLCMHEVTQTLTEHYETCLARHGATAQGMDWGENTARLALRFDAIGRAIGLDEHDRKMSLLDVGCGCGLLLNHLQSRWPSRVEYSGMDASAKMIAAARKAHPEDR